MPQIKFLFIELCTFARLFKKSEYRESLHRWLYTIKNMGEESTEECPFDDPIFQDFFEQGKVEKLTIMEKEDYAKSILEYREVKDTIEYERECARNEGRVEGEKKAKRAMAKSMLEKGIDLDTILSITGLTAEEIEVEY